MATATVARPANALRTRRDPPRPMAVKRMSTTEGGIELSAKKRKLEEPYVITREHILRKFAGKQPSLIVHLHQNSFKFEGQEDTHQYESPMKEFITHLKQQTIPHNLIEQLILEEVPFYDGCLIVEVHNHRTAGKKDKGRKDSADGDQVKFSMHNYNSYITPSPYVPYPKKVKEPGKSNAEAETAKEKKAESKDKDGPQVSTIVMFPTALSMHREQILLMNTPASELKPKRKSADGTTPSSTHPPTPSLSVPPTPLATGQERKMCIEQHELYDFERDTLLATQPPLYLEPVKNPQEAEKVLDLLAHPLHSEAPPAPKTRKRTSAEMAADDAQAADAERRMLIMDERIKPMAPGAGDAAGSAHNMGVSRFKTLLMAREAAEERKTKEKEVEAEKALKKRQEDEAAQQAQAAKQAAAERSRQLMMQRQEQARQHQQQQQQLKQAQIAQLAQAQQHAHPQMNMMNQQQANFQHPASIPQSSPVVRNQTPLVNGSSPMMQQNGFATTSQGAGSPVRPTTAAIPGHVAMGRQTSQQQQASRGGTPHITQSTPHMGAMGNRQPSQTPRMGHGSPAPNTPAGNGVAQMQIQNGQGLTQEQMTMLRMQQHQHQQAAMSAGSPGQGGGTMLTPEQVQQVRQQQMRNHLMAQQAAQGNPAMQTQLMQQRQAMLMRQQQQQQLHRQQNMMQQQQQGGGQAGSPPMGMQQTSQMGHGHPQQVGMNQGQQQMTPQQTAAKQQQAQMYRHAQATLQQVGQQYGGIPNIPADVVAQLPPPAQMLLQRQRQQQQAQQAFRAQQMAMRAQQAQQSGQAVASGQADPEYMQTLRQHQAMLHAAAAQQGGQGNQGGQMKGMSMNMSFANQRMGNQGQQGGQDLSQQFAAMQNALNRSQQGGMG